MGMIIVNSSERGLCGGINSSIAKEAIAEKTQIEKDGGEVSVCILGDKAKGQLKRPAGHLVEKVMGDAGVYTFSTALAVAENLVASDADAFDVLHQHFISQVSYEPNHKRFPNLSAARKMIEGGAV